MSETVDEKAIIAKYTTLLDEETQQLQLALKENADKRSAVTVKIKALIAAGLSEASIDAAMSHELGLSKPKTPRAPKGSNVPSADSIERILSAFEPGEMQSAPNVAKAASVDGSTTSKVLAYLVKNGKLTKHGERKGSKYQIVVAE